VVAKPKVTKPKKATFADLENMVKGGKSPVNKVKITPKKKKK
jgi:hypothetical protein